MTEQKSQPLRFTLTHYRQPQHTHEEFIRWIVEEHLPVAVPIFKKYGILVYTLFVTPAQLNEGLKAQVGNLRSTWEYADFDCFIEYTVPNMQSIMNIMGDADWLEAMKDEPQWVDSSKSLVSLGYATTYVQDGQETENMVKKA